MTGVNTSQYVKDKLEVATLRACSIGYVPKNIINLSIQDDGTVELPNGMKIPIPTPIVTGKQIGRASCRERVSLND